MKSVIWDWNGTLLDDLDHCIASINVLLEKRQLPLLSHKHYKEVFSFPVKDYYAAIGFDFSKEDFAIPAREFIDLYNAKAELCSLHSAVNDVLSHLQRKGIRQFVLSAMQEDMLVKTLKQQGILNYFDAIAGLDHHYATSKIERGEQLIEQNKISKDNAIMIGDTIHDFEVAEQLGIKCILLADGHQSAKRLKSTGAQVLDNLGDLLKNGLI